MVSLGSEELGGSASRERGVTWQSPCLEGVGEREQSVGLVGHEIGPLGHL